MIRTTARYWWLVVLRGVAAVLFGILAFVWPQLTLGALILLFAGYALVDGIMSIGASIRERHVHSRWWMGLIEGALGITAAILAVVWPGLTAVALLYLIAAWAIVTGIFELVAAISLRKQISGQWALGFAGIASIILGAILFLNPGTGVLALIWVIGAYALVFGGLLIYLGIKLRVEYASKDTDEEGTGQLRHA